MCFEKAACESHHLSSLVSSRSRGQRCGRRSEICLMNTKLHSIRARLYDRYQASARIVGSHFGGHASERRVNRGGVMGKIIIDRDTSNRAQMLHAPFDPFKFAQSCNEVAAINPMARSNRCKGVSHVMLASQAPFHRAATTTSPVAP